MAVFETNDDSFDKDVLKAGQLVLVDFWAQWCGPCKALSPILEEVAQGLGDKAKIMKVNIDHNRLVASQYGVRSIPTLMLFKDGKVVSTKVGALTKSKLQDWVSEFLA